MTDEREVIQTGGPPKPPEDVPCATALHDLNEQIAELRKHIANATLQLTEIEKKLKTWEVK